MYYRNDQPVENYMVIGNNDYDEPEYLPAEPAGFLLEFTGEEVEVQDGHIYDIPGDLPGLDGGYDYYDEETGVVLCDDEFVIEKISELEFPGTKDGFYRLYGTVEFCYTIDGVEYIPARSKYEDPEHNYEDVERNFDSIIADLKLK